MKIEYFNDCFEIPNTNGTLNLDLVSSVLSCAGLSTLNYCLFWWTNLDIFAGGDAAAEPPGGLAGRVGRAGAALLRAVSIII